MPTKGHKKATIYNKSYTSPRFLSGLFGTTLTTTTPRSGTDKKYCKQYVMDDVDQELVQSSESDTLFLQEIRSISWKSERAHKKKLRVPKISHFYLQDLIFSKVFAKQKGLFIKDVINFLRFLTPLPLRYQFY